jgi:hypothetical protein
MTAASPDSVFDIDLRRIPTRGRFGPWSNFQAAVNLALTAGTYHPMVLLVHGIPGVRAAPSSLLRAGGLPGSHGPENTPFLAGEYEESVKPRSRGGVNGSLAMIFLEAGVALSRQVAWSPHLFLFEIARIEGMRLFFEDVGGNFLLPTPLPPQWKSLDFGMMRTFLG